MPIRPGRQSGSSRQGLQGLLLIRADAEDLGQAGAVKLPVEVGAEGAEHPVPTRPPAACTLTLDNLIRRDEDRGNASARTCPRSSPRRPAVVSGFVTVDLSPEAR